jgi:hypothetical protein
MQDRQFGEVYRQAASRLCVSPFMEEDYRRRYGVEGQVLYPSRAKDCPLFDQAPATYIKDTGPLIGAYAGNIFHAGYARLILTLAESLDRRGGRLLLFGPHSREQLTAWGLNRPNVLAQGLVASEDLVSRLRDEADFVFVPMAFDSDGSQHNMRISFPSKLTDYTATGLPLLICGPDYCSAVRWAQRYGGLAEVVTTPIADGIDAAVQRLEQRQYRERLGQASMQIGNDLFSHRAAADILYSVIMAGGSGVPSHGAASKECGAASAE